MGNLNQTIQAMTNDELIAERWQLDEMIYEWQCYSVGDCVRLNAVCDEMDERGIFWE